MKVRLWIWFAISSVLVISMIVLVSHILSQLLQMSRMGEYIGIGISIVCATVGIVLAIIYYTKQKK